MDASSPRPALRERLTAIAVLVLIAAVVVMTLVALVGDLGRALIQIVLLVAVVFAAWYGITRVGRGRALALVVGLLALAGFVLVGLARDGEPVTVVVRAVLLLLAIGLTRLALAQNVEVLKPERDPGDPGAARHAPGADHEPEVRRREGRAVPSGRRMSRARHRTSGAAAGRRSARPRTTRPSTGAPT